MARKGPASEARKVLLWLGALTVILALLLTGGTLWWGASPAPKLALDLEGGTQMILAPKVDGGASINEDQLNQAVSIIRQRVDGTGVAEAQISTSGTNVVVALPGTPSNETRNLIKASANMAFRPVIQAGQGQATPADQLVPDAQIPQPTAAPTNGSDPNWVTPDVFKEFQTYSCVPPVTEPVSNADPTKATVACDPVNGIK